MESRKKRIPIQLEESIQQRSVPHNKSALLCLISHFIQFYPKCIGPNICTVDYAYINLSEGTKNCHHNDSYMQNY